MAEISTTDFDNKFARESKISLKWLIKEEALRECKNKKMHTEKYFVSKIPGIRYCLRLHDTYLDKPNEFWFYIHLKFKAIKSLNAEFTLTIASASKTIKATELVKKYYGCVRKLCTRDELFDPKNKYFVDGVLTIELQGILKPEGLRKIAPTLKAIALTRALWEKDDRDFTIYIKNKSFTVHKWVLAARSAVFEAMFRSGMKEAKENKVEINDFEPEIIKIMIEFCYERNILNLITEENASDYYES